MNPANREPARDLSALMAKGWRDNGPTVTTADAWNLTVAIVPAQDDPRATPDALSRTSAERRRVVRAIAAVPELVRELAGVTEFLMATACQPADLLSEAQRGAMRRRALAAMVVLERLHRADYGRTEPAGDAAIGAVEPGAPSATADR